MRQAAPQPQSASNEQLSRAQPCASPRARLPQRMCAGHTKPLLHEIAAQRPSLWQAKPSPHDVAVHRGAQRVLVALPLGLQRPLAGVHGSTYESQ